MCITLEQAIRSNRDVESSDLDLGLHYENVGRVSCCWLGRKIFLVHDEVLGWSFQEYNFFWLIIRFLFSCCFQSTHLKNVCQHLSEETGAFELKVHLHQLWIEVYPNENSPLSRGVESYRNLLADGFNESQGITETDLEEVAQLLQTYPTTKKLFDDAELAAKENFNEDLVLTIIPSLESYSTWAGGAANGSELQISDGLRKSELQAIVIFELSNIKNFNGFNKVRRKAGEGLITSAQDYAVEMETAEFKTIKETVEIIEKVRREGLVVFSSYMEGWQRMASNEEAHWESVLRDCPDHFDFFRKQFEQLYQFKNLQNEENSPSTSTGFVA
jgi:hypothetical protein